MPMLLLPPCRLKCCRWRVWWCGGRRLCKLLDMLLSVRIHNTESLAILQMASVVVREVETLQAASSVRQSSYAGPATDGSASAQEQAEWQPPSTPAVAFVDATDGAWLTVAVEEGIEAVCTSFGISLSFPACRADVLCCAFTIHVSLFGSAWKT